MTLEQARDIAQKAYNDALRIHLAIMLDEGTVNAINTLQCIAIAEQHRNEVLQQLLLQVDL